MTSTDLNSIEAASVVDARGSACPGPLLEAKKGIGKVKVGEVLEILSNDSATKNDIPVWANKVGHESWLSRSRWLRSHFCQAEEVTIHPMG